jgi:GntR family transcriptional regulator/MocR family aminotransferase
MAKRTSTLLGPAFEIDPTRCAPLYRQLYEGLRAAILGGQLRPGSRLPSTRDLAADLGVSRNTVLSAFEQLIAEGYLEGEVGSGTFVSRKLLRMVAEAPVRPSVAPRSRAPELSARGRRMAAEATKFNCSSTAPGLLRPGVPALDEFPRAVWARIAGRKARAADAASLWYGDPAGYMPLREAIAQYLGITRAVRCDPEQVVITAGTQQSINLFATLLADTDEPVWVEDPGYRGVRAALLGARARIVGVPVDSEGIDVAAGERLCPDARVAYVTPSHQYPTGATMSLARRLALLEWANRAGAWIVEDDYDSEFCLSGRPIAALQGLDAGGRVMYAGTFSKVLYAGLGIGYVVVPRSVLPEVVSARVAAGRQPSIAEQVVLASFISQGHFARHVRTMRELYVERQRVLVDALDTRLGDMLDVCPTRHGLNTVARFFGRIDDAAIARESLAAGLEVQPLSQYFCGAAPRPGLILGHAGYPPEAIRTGVERLEAVVRRVAAGSGRLAAAR